MTMLKKKQKQYITKKAIESLLVFLRGILMGLADTIPGVSGGTIALITGIYERLIRAISNLNIAFIIDFFKGRKWQNNFNRIDFWLFVPLGLGIGLAIFFFSGVIDYLLTDHSGITFAFFLGLIMASAIILFAKVKLIDAWTGLATVTGFGFAFYIAGLSMGSFLGHSYPAILFSGAIAICAMILPGISGAFILLLLGQYEYLIGILHDLDLLRIATFGVGAGFGIIIFSRLINFLLKRFRPHTLAFLTGLMLGSIRLPVIRMAEAYTTYPPLVIAALGGFILVLLIEGLFRKR